MRQYPLLWTYEHVTAIRHNRFRPIWVSIQRIGVHAINGNAIILSRVDFDGDRIAHVAILDPTTTDGPVHIHSTDAEVSPIWN